MKHYLKFICILFLTVTSVSAQNLRKANHLFDIRAYVDAAELYLEETNKTADVYAKLGDCYFYNSNMREAATWYGTLIKNFPGEFSNSYLYKYAQALKGIEKFDEADEWFEKYQQKAMEEPGNISKTVPFFSELNSKIDRPYIVSHALANGENSDFAPAYFGDLIVFASTRVDAKLYDWNKKPYVDLFQAKVSEDGDLTNVQPFSSDLNAASLHESNAVFTKDGKTVYFTRNNNRKGKILRDNDKISQLKIYRAQLENGAWTNIEELPFNGENYSTEHPALSPDEKTLIFSSDRPSGFGSFDLYKVTILEDGSFSAPENLGPSVNTEHREQFPFISSRNHLYFSSNGHFGLGGLDVFKSELKDGSYQTPANLSDKINSPLDDFGFIIDEESETGYFSSNRNGNGLDALYKFEQFKRYYVEGYVRDINSNEIIAGALVSLKDASGTLIGEQQIGADGFYSLEVQKNTSYSITGSMQFYNSSTVEFEADDEGKINKDIKLALLSFEDAEAAIVEERGKIQVKINNIYFDFNKWDIKEESKKELDIIVDIMKKYPTMKIEIGAHTDFIGTKEYNLILSDHRAKAALDYIVAHGIESERLSSKGYGESSPLVECERGNCTEEVHSMNRRCEFVIIE